RRRTCCGCFGCFSLQEAFRGGGRSATGCGRGRWFVLSHYLYGQGRGASGQLRGFNYLENEDRKTPEWKTPSQENRNQLSRTVPGSKNFGVGCSCSGRFK